MATVLGTGFLGVALFFVVLTTLLIIRLGFVRLESAAGIGRDGLPLGKAMPAWSLPDLTGQIQKTPTLDCWQFLIFVDHALGGFPSLVTGMHTLALAKEWVEVVILSRGTKDFCEAMVRGLNLQVPVMPVASSFYDRCNVRVMPFAFLLNPQGIVRWTGIVNTQALLLHVWKVYQAVEQNPREEAKR